MMSDISTWHPPDGRSVDEPTLPGAPAPAVVPSAPPAAGSSRAGAWELAFHRHHDELVRLATMLCGDRQMAEDAVADVFVNIADRIDTVTDLKPFLRRSVVNRLNDGHRRRAVRRRPLAVPPTHPDPVIEAALATSEQRAVWAAVQGLPQRQRDCVVLRHFADLPEADIAATLGISRTTVNTHLERAHAELARRLEVLR